MTRWWILVTALAACYEPPSNACGIACVSSCPSPDMTCTNGLCVSSSCAATDALLPADGARPPFRLVQIQAISAKGMFATRAVTLANQFAGDLELVVVGWNATTGQVLSVADTAGNTYHLAAARLAGPPSISQALYYAYGIAASASNTVTVTYDMNVKDSDLRIVEYSGVANASDPLDVVASMAGSTATSDSGPVLTSVPHELILAANTVAGPAATTMAGPGFQSVGISTLGDIVEALTADAVGSYEPTATLSKAGAWVMQAAAFRGP